ncbi:hypothetical protein M5K25_012827 [Dendrobium thyrsiflorum]|uniref:Uncharacterized protein n=1 Tax=Dendrobium thyrsiflorum TaxID=117978 RepID=A0ABD0V5B5_DENTH
MGLWGTCLRCAVVSPYALRRLRVLMFVPATLEKREYKAYPPRRRCRTGFPSHHAREKRVWAIFRRQGLDLVRFWSHGMGKDGVVFQLGGFARVGWLEATGMSLANCRRVRRWLKPMRLAGKRARQKQREEIVGFGQPQAWG